MQQHYEFISHPEKIFVSSSNNVFQEKCIAGQLYILFEES